jgi:hypothetical protein
MASEFPTIRTENTSFPSSDTEPGYRYPAAHAELSSSKQMLAGVSSDLSRYVSRSPLKMTPSPLNYQTIENSFPCWRWSTFSQMIGFPTNIHFLRSLPRNKNGEYLET